MQRAVLLLALACFTYAGHFFDFLPVHKGKLQPAVATSAQWDAPCFQTNTAKLTHFGDDGATIAIDVSKPTSLLCYDLYVVITSQKIHIKPIILHGHHEVVISSWAENEKLDVEKTGIQILLVKDHVLGTLRDVWDTYQLFRQLSSNTVKQNLAFLKENMNITLVPRDKTPIIIDESLIHTGDYFAITRLQGADSVIMYGTGGLTGHTAVAMWIDNELFVVESTGDKDYWPPPHGVIRTPYRKWMQLAIDVGYLVDFLPLSKETREKLNTEAAVKYFKSIEGLPYGYHNFFFGFIDTEKDNFPHGLDAQQVALLFTVLDYFDPSLTSRVFNAALNMRLGTPQSYRFLQILEHIDQHNMSFAEVMARPEQDKWVYPDGASLVCSSFAIAIYKAGGVFGNMTDLIQATEFTPKDSYQVKLFDDNSLSYLPAECKRDGLPFCQVTGDHKLILPGFNTIAPYARMNERCSSLPPRYERPAGC